MLDIGCGKSKIVSTNYNVIGIDLWDNSDADLKISAFDLPFEDSMVNRIYSRHFFEHFNYNEIETLFSECFRVLKDGGEFEIITPHVSCISAFQDPTHISFFTKKTFSRFQHIGFEILKTEFHWFRKPYKGKFNRLVRILNYVINRYPNMERFSGIFGGIYEIKCLYRKNPNYINEKFIMGSKINE